MALIQESNESGGFLVPAMWVEPMKEFLDGEISMAQLQERVSVGLAPYRRPSLSTKARRWLGDHLFAAARWLDPSLPSWDDVD